MKRKSFLSSLLALPLLSLFRRENPVSKFATISFFKKGGGEFHRRIIHRDYDEFTFDNRFADIISPVYLGWKRERFSLVGGKILHNDSLEIVLEFDSVSIDVLIIRDDTMVATVA